ncbi:hypothetical protein [Litorilituus sediminis]|uniref:Uncharacterized protein n=1 Tax=Litorilituus sediminis TaxID=718192 RepID=A0A4P6PBP1_9GAMM|nr:hypothetical protein [Litorilituus sediminis]QBG37057.1 hypothetical protein EMK97_15660 [Litorilituus sediminis]
MNLSSLSFNALPPIDLPFRFFFTAPIFIIISALIMLSFGESLWLSRWTPSMLSITHGFTLGFITSVMMGALLQLLPVIGGVGISKPRLVASFCHLFHCLGTLALMAAFLHYGAWLYSVAAICLSLSFAVYIFALCAVLLKKLSQGHIIIGIRLAVAALLALVIMGLLLISRYLELPFYFISGDKFFTNIHAVLGLGAWASLLLMSVSFQVVPMFHVAPNFPTWFTKSLPWLFLLSILLLFYQYDFALYLLMILHALFALCLLYVLGKRKRKVADTSIQYWQFSAIILLLISCLYFISELEISSALLNVLVLKKTMLLTALFIFGFLVSVIQGMLLKILPFLSYTHLQQRCLIDFNAMQFIPHMHEFLHKRHGSWLFYLHILSCLALVSAILSPSVYWLFACSLLVEFLWLLFIMIKTMRLYFAVDKKISLSCQR